MIHHLRGTLIERYPTHLVIECGGVGYEAQIPISTYEALPDGRDPQCFLLIHHHIWEDGQQLFAFHTAQERDLFRLLITIKGIGPRVALSVLSGLPVDSLRRAISAGDVQSLSRIKGIGKRTAERMVVELRDRLGIPTSSTTGIPATPLPGGAHANQVLQDAVLTLVTLGYKQGDAVTAVTQILKDDDGEMTVEDVVRLALRRLAG
jgi:Holliday junction DNA helicase RuvA